MRKRAKAQNLKTSKSQNLSRGGFTLPELLVTMGIIGTLATMGTVSYSSVRVKARDLNRVADTKQLQTALELFFDAHGFYPPDGIKGNGGLILGEDGALTLSDAGFAPSPNGSVYMSSVAKNPVPFGVRYMYRSLNADGTDCDAGRCPAYAILFALEHSSEGLSAGPHEMTTYGIKDAIGFPKDAYVTQQPTGGVEAVQTRVDYTATQTADAVIRVVQDPRVTAATQIVVAPTVAVASVVNVAYASSQFGQYLLFFLTQPAALFGLRRRKSWGTVYDAITHMPVDLAIVRLYNMMTNKVVQSTVTDGEGHYSFLVPAGSYRIVVAKVGIVFPSSVAAVKEEDGPYHDLYHGDAIAVGKEGGIIVHNIPVDPPGVDVPDETVLKQAKQKRWHRGVALVSPVLGGMAMVIKPSIFIALLFAAELVVYALFVRLSKGKPPKGWGTVYHQATEQPVAQAVVRIFEAKYNKLLEAQVTDFLGRYHFRVGANRYFLTATKQGFRKTETEPFDLSHVTDSVVVASDLPLAPTKGGLVVAARHISAVKPKSVLPPPPGARGIGAQKVAVGRFMPDVPASLAEDKRKTEPVPKKTAEADASAPAVPDSLRSPSAPPAPPEPKPPMLPPKPSEPAPSSEPPQPPPAPPQPPDMTVVPPTEKKAPPPSRVWFRDN